jgi:hypothetical protein
MVRDPKDRLDPERLRPIDPSGNSIHSGHVLRGLGRSDACEQ